MKILVLFAGGTIGSSESSGYIRPEEGANYRLLSLFREKQKLVQTDEPALSHAQKQFDQSDALAVELVPITAFQMLSENSDGEFLNRLADAVRSAQEQAEQQGMAGIIVTHGTDTLAYSAAMLGYVFADNPLPIVLVSSNYVLDHPKANGLTNFVHAVDFIASNLGGGVYVSYQNTGEKPRIHLGTRLLGHQAYSDAVHSMAGYSTTERNMAEHDRAEQKSFCPEKTENPLTRLSLAAKFQAEAPILQIFPSPGMAYPVIRDGIQAVLHHSYHSGTICSHGAGMEAFFAEASRRQIPVFLAGADPQMVYESMKIYEKYQIHVLPVASPLSMYMKLWLLLVNDLDPIEWMGKNIAGEVVLLR